MKSERGYIVVPPPPYCETCQDCSNACHKEYKLLAREEALERMMSRVVFKVGTEIVPLRSALERVTAKNIYARYSLPVSNTAMKDGVAVKSAELGVTIPDTKDWQPGINYLVAGMGDALPEGYDTLILAEKIRFLDNGKLEILEMPLIRQNVSTLGSKVSVGDKVVPAHLKLQPTHLGMLASAGITEVEVLRKPQVAILPTGNELVPLGIKPAVGQNVESNGIFLEASLRQWGAEAQLYPIIRDEPGELERGIRTALIQADIILVNGGTGRGWEHYNDYTAKVVEEIGEILVHGLLMGPGKPTIIGLIEGKPVIGIPGPPHAAIVITDIYVRPLIDKFLCQLPTSGRRVKAVLAEDFRSGVGSEMFRRVKLSWDGESYRVHALSRLGDTVENMVEAQGTLHVSLDSAGYAQGEEVEIELLYSEEIIKAQSADSRKK
jgi:molybdenum cofactor synthesis domain-containing protein